MPPKNSRRSKSRPPQDNQQIIIRPIVTAVLIDGGFYRHRAHSLFGEKTAKERANEIVMYARRHIKESRGSLYRIYYYDCPPSERVLFHPLKREAVNLAKTEQFKWSIDFFNELTHKRKLALRRGEELETQNGYMLKVKPLRKLCSGKLKVEDLRESDFELDITQKGVDMRIGVDIASLAHNSLVNQIVMITGDSDFVPAAKLARRAGIDFILDPMWAPITDSLSEHVDGIRSCVYKYPESMKDPLHKCNLAKALDSDDALEDEEI